MKKCCRKILIQTFFCRYKKSSRLEAKNADKPKRVYEVIKPVINDDFDKQVQSMIGRHT